jgi:hypothetical protein
MLPFQSLPYLERKMFHFQSFLLRSPPPSSLNGAPMERDALHQSLLLHIFQSSQ